ncbi:MAG: hypothetical protein NTW55_08900 [Planctomycetota bacterium]|nr:hypothetical protein [Planctomycetota bacterium]
MKPNDGYIAYIVNPKSGASGSRLISRMFKEYLVGGGFDVRISYTKSLENACRLAADAAVHQLHKIT